MILSGPDAESHDYAEGEGSFAKVVERLVDARAVTPVTRSNMRALPRIADLLKRHDASGWRLVCVGVERDPDPRCPRLAMAVPRVLHAAASAGIDVELEGFPRCLLGPWAKLAVPSARRSFPPRCSPCGLRSECPGVDAAYVARYGDAELSPRTGDISSQPKRRK